MMVLGGGAVYYERGTPVPRPHGAAPRPPRTAVQGLLESKDTHRP